MDELSGELVEVLLSLPEENEKIHNGKLFLSKVGVVPKEPRFTGKINRGFCLTLKVILLGLSTFHCVLRIITRSLEDYSKKLRNV